MTGLWPSTLPTAVVSVSTFVSGVGGVLSSGRKHLNYDLTGSGGAYLILNDDWSNFTGSSLSTNKKIITGSYQSI